MLWFKTVSLLTGRRIVELLIKAYWKIFVDFDVIDTGLNPWNLSSVKVVGVLLEIRAQHLSSTSNKIVSYINSVVIERGS